MAREDEFQAVMLADTPLTAILTGGVYTAGTVGMLGITRDAAPAAFSGGWLRPCALVRQRGNVPTLDVIDDDAQITSARQVIEVYLYQEGGGFDAIDAAAARMYTLFQGRVLTDSFEVRLVNDIDRQREQGVLNGASLRRLEWQVDSIMG